MIRNSFRVFVAITVLVGLCIVGAFIVLIVLIMVLAHA
jgi:hypothetical protein